MASSKLNSGPRSAEDEDEQKENLSVGGMALGPGSPKPEAPDLEHHSGSTNSNSDEEVEEPRTEERKVTEITESIELTNQVLSYDKFYPGRILGNTFQLRNLTD